MNITATNYQASINLEEIFSQKEQSKLQNLIWKSPISERENIWNKNNIPYKNIEKAFIGLVIQRNIHARADGFNSHIDFMLDRLGIPKTNLDSMLKNVDSTIKLCNKLLEKQKPKDNLFYSEFGNHCYLCEMENFPFDNLKDAAIATKQDLNKIKVLRDNMSFITYNNSIGKIHLDKRQNLRHSSIDLIHEIFHLQTREPEGITNKYISEKKVLVRELEFYKTNYPAIYTAFFGELLKVFHRVLFEIELYKNPNQDLAKLYARIFNKCYEGKYQKQNRSYLLDTLIIRYPFQNLPHMLAQIDVLTSLKL